MAAASGALKEPYAGEEDSCDGHNDILDSEDEESHQYEEEEEGRREEEEEEGEEEEDFQATALGDHADPNRQVSWQVKGRENKAREIHTVERPKGGSIREVWERVS
jgi:hypothetical protein